ncbi:MAG: hypothetical protein SVW77_03055 [Candidatus Nanohaloarchaea archaeon]|nr:hypothetical protein [Candidatus Nanohaloarchaea archaeon]
MNVKRRYRDIVGYYGDHSLVLGGAASVQLTGHPTEIGTIDETMRQFFGNAEEPSVPAIAPLGWALFMNSPRISGGELTTMYGREDAYFERHARSPVLTQEEGEAKYGYIPELGGTVERLRDIADVLSQKPLEFTADVRADEIIPVDGGPGLHERSEYPIDDDTPLTVLATHRERGGWNTITLEDFVEEQYVRGVVSLQTIDGEWRVEDVVLDYTDQRPQEFEDIAWRSFLKAEGMNKPNYRPRLGIGGVESRDYCNSPYLEENVSMQAAWFRNWPAIQQAAYHDLELREDDAEDLREGVISDGLAYELPSGHTVRQAIDVLRQPWIDGVTAAADSGQTVNRFREYLDRIEDGAEPPAHDIFEAFKNDRLEDAVQRTRTDHPSPWEYQ